MRPSPKKRVKPETDETQNINKNTDELPRKKKKQKIKSSKSNSLTMHYDISEKNCKVMLESDLHNKRKDDDETVSEIDEEIVVKKEILGSNKQDKKHKNKKAHKTIIFESETSGEETIEKIKQEILDQDAEIRMKKMKDTIQFPNLLNIKTEDLGSSSDSSANEPSHPKISNSNKKKKTADISSSDDGVYSEGDVFDEADQSVLSEQSYFRQLSRCGLQITWELPELHKIIKHVTRHPDQNVRDQIESLGLTYRQGHFTPEEDTIIKQNWIRLCEEYNLPDAPEIFGRWRNSHNDLKLALARRAAIMYISQGLPHRTPVQIYYRFVHSLGKKVKGRFSEKEKEIIEMFYSTQKNNQRTQQFLANILRRDVPSVWRYLSHREQRNKNPKKIIWDLKLCEKFVRALLKLVRPSDDTTWNVNILLNRKIIWSEWVSVSKELDMLPIQLKVHWQNKLYVQLFATEPVYLSEVRMKLLKIFIKKKYKHWQDIMWAEVASNFKNHTTLFLFNIFHRFTRNQCPSHILKDFRGVISHLQESHKQLVNKKLSRLGMDADGRLFSVK